MRDQLFCFLDVLGFSNLITKESLDSIYAKYEVLIAAAIAGERDGLFLSSRGSHLVIGYERIEYAYFSDTIVFWCPYDFHHIESLARSMNEVLCRSLEIGLPLRGAISVGQAKLEKEKNIFLGAPIVSAANAEKVQRWIGVTLSSEFREPPFNGGLRADCFRPYERHIKEGGISQVTPLVLDFPRHWRATRSSSLQSAVRALDRDPAFSSYYTNTLEFVDTSEQNERWWESHPEYKRWLTSRSTGPRA